MLGEWMRKLFRRDGVVVEDGGANETFPPESLVIPHDDHHGTLVGRTADGDGFFITTPFTAGPRPADSREFVACYRFAPAGDLREAKIESLGSRADLVGAARAHLLPGNAVEGNSKTRQVIERFLAELGDVTYEDIRVRPFRVERFGIAFGLIPDSADDLDEDEDYMPHYVTLLPGNYMAFYAPWEGEYDT